YTNRGALCVRMGENLFVGSGFKLRVDGVELLRLNVGERGQLLLSVQLLDESGNVVCLIEDNEWVVGDYRLFDVHAVPRFLAIRRANRDVSLAIDAREEAIAISGTFHANGNSFSAQKDFFAVGGPFRIAWVGFAFFELGFNVSTESKKLQVTGDTADGIMVPMSRTPRDRSALRGVLDQYRQWRRQRS
ncbi:MAG TPA: hypothetical protein PKE51_11315, partial [Gemmatimonadaceae bacterium]|nr:hypothetical protein [Gemmatimonadaceae bacterium]